MEKVYVGKMDSAYKDICYYNLLEKHFCGGISSADFDKIAKRFR